jgi:hypothetical protein
MTQTLSREKLLKHIQVAEGMENLGGGSEAERDLLTLYRMALASLDGAERVKQLEAELAQLKLKLIGDCV